MSLSVCLDQSRLAALAGSVTPPARTLNQGGTIFGNPVVLNGGTALPEHDHLIAAILAAGFLAQRPISHPERHPRANIKAAVALYHECLNELSLGEPSSDR